MSSRLTKKSIVNVPGRLVKTPCVGLPAFAPKARRPPTSTASPAPSASAIALDPPTAPQPTSYYIHASARSRVLLPQLCWGRWREAPDGVWPAAGTSVRLHERHREPFIDASLFSAPQSAPPAALRRRGSSSLAQRRTNAVDDDRQSADDELVGKSKNAKSRASKPCIPLGVLDHRIRRLVRAAVPPGSQSGGQRRSFAQDKRNPRNRVRSAFACESRVRRSDDSVPRAKAWSPPLSCSDAARERTCARTDGNAAARPSCLPITSVTPSPLHERHREAFIDGFLLSTPHPALRATFPASRRRARLAGRAQLDNDLWESGRAPGAARFSTRQLAEHVGADFPCDLDDGVARYVVAAGRRADRLRVRRFIEAIGLLLVGAEEGKDPCHALLLVDPLDAVDAVFCQGQLLGKAPFDNVARHIVFSLKAFCGRRPSKVNGSS